LIDQYLVGHHLVMIYLDLHWDKAFRSSVTVGMSTVTTQIYFLCFRQGRKLTGLVFICQIMGLHLYIVGDFLLVI